MSSSNTPTTNNRLALQMTDTKNIDKEEMREMLHFVDTASMSNMWDKEPRRFHLQAISTLLEMHYLSSNPPSMLLIQGTDSSKLTVLQTVGVVTCGMTLIIKNTLLLAADQQSKYGCAIKNHSPIMAYQMDSLSDKNDVTNMLKMLLELSNGTNASIYIHLMKK